MEQVVLDPREHVAYDRRADELSVAGNGPVHHDVAIGLLPASASLLSLRQQVEASAERHRQSCSRDTCAQVTIALGHLFNACCVTCACAILPVSCTYLLFKVFCIPIHLLDRTIRVKLLIHAYLIQRASKQVLDVLCHPRTNHSHHTPEPPWQSHTEPIGCLLQSIPVVSLASQTLHCYWTALAVSTRTEAASGRQAHRQ